MEFPEEVFENLETLNISGNLLTSFPDGIVRCLKMQKIYSSYNKLTFEGLNIICIQKFRFTRGYWKISTTSSFIFITQ